MRKSLTIVAVLSSLVGTAWSFFLWANSILDPNPTVWWVPVLLGPVIGVLILLGMISPGRPVPSLKHYILFFIGPYVATMAAIGIFLIYYFSS